MVAKSVGKPGWMLTSTPVVIAPKLGHKSDHRLYSKVEERRSSDHSSSSACLHDEGWRGHFAPQCRDFANGVAQRVGRRQLSQRLAVALNRSAETGDHADRISNMPWRGLSIFRHHTLLKINAFRVSMLSASLPESGNQGSDIMAETGQMAYTRTIRRQQLREIVPLADSTIFGMEQRGEFPRRFALSPRCVVWDLAEVEEWLASRRMRPIERGQQVDVRHRRTHPVKGSDQVQA